MKDVQGIRFTKDGLTFKASQIKRGMTFAKILQLPKGFLSPIGWEPQNGRIY